MEDRLEILSNSYPVASWILRFLRDESTGPGDFRSFMKLAGTLLAFAVSRELGWEPVEVRTPLGAVAKEAELKEPPLLVGVLGASIPMIQGFLEVYRGSPIALVAAKRVEREGYVEVKVYYSRLPGEWRGTAVIIDPMLATGKTASEVAWRLKRIGAGNIVVATIIASRHGVESLSREHPDIKVYTLSLDPELNKDFFIVPGLGDAGDRALGVIF